MIQGRSSIVGRVRPDSLSEWYVKDYQGSLALSVVGNGYGTALTYAPYGAQHLLRSDGVPPAEQYTGKEWDGTYEFYYFGARFLDPVLGMWVVPDPAGQFANPYGFGGDPVNYTDPDGRFVHLIVGAVIGAGVGAYQAYKNDASFWEAVGYIGGGAAIGTAVAATGGAVGGAVIAGGGGTVGAGMSAGFVGGAMSGGLNYSLNAGIQGGFSANGLAQSIAIGGISGMVGGGVGGAIGSGAFGAFGGGFAGGATGSALSGARGMDIVYGGLAGAGIALGGYSLATGMQYASEEYSIRMAESEVECADCPRKPAGSVALGSDVKEAKASFIEYDNGNPNKTTESWQAYKRNNLLNRLLSGKSVSLIDGGYGKAPGESNIKFSGNRAIVIHSHRYADYPSGQDYTGAASLWSVSRSSSYVLSPNGRSLYYVPPYQTNPGVNSRYYEGY